jgi:Fe-Mn family superoxide dismutase
MRRLFFCFAFSLQTLTAAYQAKNFDPLLGHVPGIADDVLRMHFKLYQGYVNNTNILLDEIEKLEQDNKSKTPFYAGLKRILGWEFDGMRLHEFYFENLGRSDLDPQSPLAQALKEHFGSIDKWKENFVATGLIRGIGWAALYQDPISKKLINIWINEHDTGHLAGGTPLLLMDVWEHAYITQYGTERAAYIKAFFDNINWDVVSKRFNEKN